MARLFWLFLFFCGRVCCRFPLQKLKGIFMRTVWSRTFYRVQQFEKSVLVELQKFKTQTYTITRNLRRRTQKCQQKYMYKKERPQSMDARNVDHTSNVRLKNLQTVLRGKNFHFLLLSFNFWQTGHRSHQAHVRRIFMLNWKWCQGHQSCLTCSWEKKTFLQLCIVKHLIANISSGALDRIWCQLTARLVVPQLSFTC